MVDAPFLQITARKLTLQPRLPDKPQLKLDMQDGAKAGGGAFEGRPSPEGVSDVAKCLEWY